MVATVPPKMVSGIIRPLHLYSKEDHIEEGIRNFASLTGLFEITQELGKCRLMVHDENPVKGSIKSHPDLPVSPS